MANLSNKFRCSMMLFSLAEPDALQVASWRKNKKHKHCHVKNAFTEKKSFVFWVELRGAAFSILRWCELVIDLHKIYITIYTSRKYNTHTNRQTDKQTDKQTAIQTNKCSSQHSKLFALHSAFRVVIRVRWNKLLTISAHDITASMLSLLLFLD